MMHTAIVIASLIVIIFLTAKIKSSTKRGRREAPGPWNLPLLGSLHRTMLSSKLPHQIFRGLSAVYGPIMSIKLGEIRVVVISSAEAAQEVMKTHDVVFARRPANVAANIISYGGNNLICSPDGEFVRQFRRISNLELLSPKRVRSFRAIREVEVAHLIQSIAASSGAVVNFSSKLTGVTGNIMARAVMGGRCEDQKLFFSLIDEIFVFISGFTPTDLFPSFPIVGRVLGYQQRVEKCHRKLDLIAEKILHEHREKMAKQVAAGVDEERLQEEDIIDVLLRIQRKGGLQFLLSDDIIKAMVNELLIAGTETTATVLEWTMSELIKNPHVMKNAQNEVREVMDGTNMHGKLVEEEITSGKLPYLQLVIKEALRLHPPAPLLLPRENQEGCEVMGYEIPAKTRVLINMWAITRDEKYWDDPDSFWPERFEVSSLDFKGANFEYAPFGSGRRICPGMQFALAVVETVLGYLLYYFDWEYLGKNLDMKEAFGLVVGRASPLVIVPTLHYPLPAST